MLADLTLDQRRLADYMSELSELAFCAGWMDGLEFALWEALQGRRRDYGRLAFTEDQRDELRMLFERAGGWIVFDDRTEESFLPLKQWEDFYARKNGEQGACT
jgi:hypothetical protein